MLSTTDGIPSGPGQNEHHLNFRAATEPGRPASQGTANATQNVTQVAKIASMLQVNEALTILFHW